MGLDADLRAALDGRLATVGGLPAAANRAGDNTAFDPPIGETWLRRTVVYGARDRLTLPADGAWVVETGLYLVDLFHPQDQGPAASDTLARAILDAFPDGLQLAAGGRTVRITGARRDGGVRAEGWHLVPLTVRWQLDTVQTVT